MQIPYVNINAESKNSDENLFREKIILPTTSFVFFFLIVVVKAYFITCFSPKVIHKECEKSNERTVSEYLKTVNVGHKL